MEASGATGLARLRAVRVERPALAAFLGVFGATFLCFLAIGAVLPVLPRYVRGPVGAGDLAVGIVIGAFALTAFFGRPLGGRLADRRGRKFVHLAGLGICVVAGALLFLPLGVAGLVVARLVVGLGDGWVFTAGVTWVVDLTPAARRGKAIGIFGLAIWGGLAVGAVLGEALYQGAGYDAVWAFATIAPLLGLLACTSVPTDGAQFDREVQAGRGLDLRNLLPREAWRPGVALALSNAGYGTMAAFVVLLLDQRGIGHGATAFTLFAASVVLTRMLLGGLPDRVGPRRTAVSAGTVQAAGMILLGSAQTWPVAAAGAVVMGAGTSLIFPSLALMVVRRTGDDERGAALGGFTAFFDLGFGLGAPLAGLVASLGAGRHYSLAFYAGAALCLLGAAVGFVSTRAIPSASARG
jgi:MFS family permease